MPIRCSLTCQGCLQCNRLLALEARSREQDQEIKDLESLIAFYEKHGRGPTTNDFFDAQTAKLNEIYRVFK